MEKERKNQLAAQIQEYLDDKEISQNKFAAYLHVSSATISNILAGKYNSISDGMWRKFENFLARPSDNIEGWKIVSTPNFQLTQLICEDAKDNSRLLALTGESGYGKSTALHYFTRKNRNTYYTLCNFIMNRKDFLLAIAKSIGISTGGRLELILTDIVDHLLSVEDPLLVLDDSGKLIDGNFRMIQLLFDRTEGRVGILLSGTNYLRKYIEDRSEKDQMGFRELKRRIEYWQELAAPDINTVHEICLQQGIEGKDEIGYVWRNAKNFGTMKALITNAKRKANGDGISLDILSNVNVS